MQGRERKGKGREGERRGWMKTFKGRGEVR